MIDRDYPYSRGSILKAGDNVLAGVCRIAKTNGSAEFALEETLDTVEDYGAVFAALLDFYDLDDDMSLRAYDLIAEMFLGYIEDDR